MPRRTARTEENKAAQIESSLRSIDAKMKLLAQRLKIMEGNDQVIGRTLVSHNKKLKELESAGFGAPDINSLKQEMSVSLKNELLEQMKEELKRSVPSAPSVLRIEEAGSRNSFPSASEDEFKNLKKAVSNLKQEVDELKYVMESINPLEYVTVTELGDIIEKKIEKELGVRKKRL